MSIIQYVHTYVCSIECMYVCNTVCTLSLNSSSVLHCIVGLFQAATLNVAINSHNKAFLTIMVSNQFVELKGSVFKKCGVDNLFQVSCSGE